MQTFLETIRTLALMRIPDLEQQGRVAKVPIHYLRYPRDLGEVLDTSGAVTDVKNCSAICGVRPDGSPKVHDAHQVLLYGWNRHYHDTKVKTAFVLLHELAHVAVKQGHTADWARMARQLGIVESTWMYQGNVRVVGIEDHHSFLDTCLQEKIEALDGWRP